MRERPSVISPDTAPDPRLAASPLVISFVGFTLRRALSARSEEAGAPRGEQIDRLAASRGSVQ